MARLQIVIDPPTQGATQAEKDFQRVGTAAQQAHQKITSGSGASRTALVGIRTDALRAAGGFQGLESTVTRNAANLQFLLRTVAPLGGAVAVMTSRFERGALIVQGMSGAVAQHTTRQQVLNNLFSQGAITAATMGAAIEKVTATTTTAGAAMAAYAQANAAVVIAQREMAAANILTAQRRVDVMTYKGAGDPKALALAERDYAAAQLASTQASITYKSALAAQEPLKARAAMLTRDQAEAEKALAAANGASVISQGSMAAAIGATIAVLVLLVAAVYAVKKAWDLMTESIKLAATEQSRQRIFTNLIENAGEARVVLDELRGISLDTGVSEAALNKSAIQMKILGDSTNSVVGDVKALAIAGLAVGKSAEEMGDTFKTVMLGKIKNPTFEATLLIRAMADASHKTMDEMKRDIKAGNVPAEEMLRLLRESTAQGGLLGKTLASWLKTYEGQVSILKERWGEFKETVGHPIVDSLTKVLTSWNTQMGPEGLTGTGEMMGKKIASAIETIGDAIQQGKFGELLEQQFDNIIIGINARLESKFQELWRVVLFELPQKEAQAFANWYKEANQVKFSEVAHWWADYWTSWAEQGKSYVLQFWDWYKSHSGAPGFVPATPAPVTPPAPALTPAPTLEQELAGKQPGAAELPSVIAPTPTAFPSRDAAGGGGQKSDFEKWKSDVHMITEYWKDYTLIQQTAQSSTENHNRSLDLLQKTIKGFADPMESVKRLIPYLSPDDAAIAKWLAWREAADRAIKASELRMEAGIANMSEVVRTGLQKMSDQWGSWQTQVSNSIGDIGNAIASDMSSSLVDIINTTGLTAQSFKDMALSIIESIEKIILQMLIQLAIQQAINAATGGAGLGSLFGGGAGGLAQGVYGPNSAASGGPVTGGSGTKDDVPIMAMAGEYVINKKAVSNIGIDTLDAINHMQEGGLVTAGRMFYGKGGKKEKGGNAESVEQAIQYSEWLQANGYGADFGTWNEPDILEGNKGWQGSDTGGRGWIEASGGGWGSGGPGSFIEAGSPWGNIIPTTLGSSGYPMAVYEGGAWGIGGGSYSSGYGMSLSGAMGSGLGLAGAGFGTPGMGGSLGPTTSTGDYQRNKWAFELGGLIPSFEKGGTMPWDGLAQLHAGETVTPAGKASPVINITITNVSGRMNTKTEVGSGMSETETREMARMVTAVVQAQIDKNRRYGGSLYVPR